MSGSKLRLRSFFLPVLSMLLAVAAQAQTRPDLDSDPSNPGLGGKNTIQGKVYYPSGQPLDKRLRVRLSSVRSGSLSTMTDDNGAFTFQRLPDGTYDLVIDAGPEYLTAHESVPVIDDGMRNSRGQTIQDLSVKQQP